MNQTVILTGFETKTGANDSGGWTLYLFSSAGGAKYQTFDDDLGRAGAALINQPADIEYDVEERELPAKGKFPARTIQNNLIRSIKASGGEAPPSTEAAVVIGVGDVISVSDYETERQLRIMRQSALDRAISTVAAGIAQTTDAVELFELADTYVKYFEEGIAAFTAEPVAVQF